MGCQVGKIWNSLVILHFLSPSSPFASSVSRSVLQRSTALTKLAGILRMVVNVTLCEEMHTPCLHLLPIHPACCSLLHLSLQIGAQGKEIGVTDERLVGVFLLQHNQQLFDPFVCIVAHRKRLYLYQVEVGSCCSE